MGVEAPKRRAPLRKRFRRALRQRVWSLFARGLALLPRPWATRAAYPLAWIASKLGPGKMAQQNLTRVFGAKAGDLKPRVFRHLARQTAETALLAHATQEKRDQLLQGVQLDPSIAHLEGALANNRGAIVITAHLGHWEILAATLSRQLGQQGAVVGRFRRHDPSAQWLVDMRAQSGVETLPQDSAPRELLRVLQRGQVLGILSDLKVGRLHGIDLPFFGHQARTMTAPAALARASHAPIVPMRCVLRAGTYTLMAEDPIHLDPNLDRDAAQRECLVRINQTFERWIREDPEQWVWYRPRWS